MGGLLGGSWGTLTVENCSVEGYLIQNRLADCLNAYYKEVSGISCYAEFYTEGECGGLIGFLARNSKISNCSVKETKMKCYGQANKEVGFEGTFASMLGKMRIAGRHVNQFVGDIRTESSNESSPVTVEIIEPFVSGNAYIGSSEMYGRVELGNSEIPAESSDAATYHNHSWTNSTTQYAGCVYYVGADVNLLNKHVGDYPGTVTITVNGTSTAISVYGGKTGSI
jgi:hypothetical protein